MLKIEPNMKKRKRLFLLVNQEKSAVKKEKTQKAVFIG